MLSTLITLTLYVVLITHDQTLSYNQSILIRDSDQCDLHTHDVMILSLKIYKQTLIAVVIVH